MPGAYRANSSYNYPMTPFLAFVVLATQQEDILGHQDTPLVPHSKWHIHDGLRPQPKIVDSGPGPEHPTYLPPKDAVVLFDGSSLSQWTGKWKIADGDMECVPGTGSVKSVPTFGDCQLHLEFNVPPTDGSGQNRGNSGIYFMGRFEVQILDSYVNQTYPDGQCGAIYGQHPPLVNPCRPPGQWQTYDIVFQAPRFNGTKLVSPAYATVLLNGVLVQDHSEYYGPSNHGQIDPYTVIKSGPIVLQDHGFKLKFRNIWVRRLNLVD